jgi:hypothetical protein
LDLNTFGSEAIVTRGTITKPGAPSSEVFLFAIRAPSKLEISDDCEWLMKLFNSLVEKRVEKGRSEIKNPCQYNRKSTLHNFWAFISE